MSIKRWYATFACFAAEAVEGNVMFCGQPMVEVGLEAGQAEIDESGEATVRVGAQCPVCGSEMLPLGVASVH